jgi:hypothetical protein
LSAAPGVAASASARPTSAKGMVWLTISAYFSQLATRSPVYGDDPEGGAGLRGSEGGLQHGRGTRGVEVDVRARLPRSHRLAGAVQLDQPADDIFGAGVDHGVGTQLQRLVEAGRDEIGDHDVADAECPEI